MRYSCTTGNTLRADAATAAAGTGPSPWSVALAAPRASSASAALAPYRSLLGQNDAHSQEERKEGKKINEINQRCECEIIKGVGVRGGGGGSTRRKRRVLYIVQVDKTPM